MCFASGCGDCYAIARALRDAGPSAASISSFTGVDMTAAALAAAGENLALVPHPMEVTMLERDMKDYVATTSDQYDVILASFAVHHLR